MQMTSPRMEAARVRRAVLQACLTCPICKKLFRDATTISECLHTFCRRCIYKKLTDEELECCPTCNIELGCSPVEKLRSDHNLQVIRAKVLPLKKRKVCTPEGPTILLPVRIKERSLSSLVVSTPRVAARSNLTGRRAKPVIRKPSLLRGSRSVFNGITKKSHSDEQLESSSSPETLAKAMQSRRESSSNMDLSNHFSNRSTLKDEIHSVEKTELWNPLNCLVEAANRTKSLKYSPHGSLPKTEQINGQDSEIALHKPKTNKSKVHEEKDSPAVSASKKVKRLLGVSRKRASAAKELCSSAQALLEASGVRRERGSGPIWFSLVPSAPQAANMALPQIPSPYLRIKDGHLPASFIQKYVAMKLDVPNEAEVDITCHGQPVSPTLELHKLVDLWLQDGPSQKAHTTVGTPAKDFVMVLNYARKSAPPP